MRSRGKPDSKPRFESLSQKGIGHCSLFAIYDGHGGAECCNYLKETFHSYILTNFDPKNAQECLKRSCIDLDDEFLKKARQELGGDTSGSCSLAMIAVGRCGLTKIANSYS